MTIKEKAKKFAEGDIDVSTRIMLRNAEGINNYNLGRYDGYLAGAEEVKADCDFALEGKDVEIKELKEEHNKLLDVINNQDVKIADLEKQIEKMKCCGNCVHYHKYFNKLYPECFFKENGNGEICKNKDKWELKE